MRTAIWVGTLSLGTVIATLVASRTGTPVREATPIEAVLEPVTVVVQAGLGGVVRAVKVRPGEAVEADQPLVEIEVPELEGAEWARRLEQLAAGIPPNLRGQLIEAHQQTVEAEAAYVAALATLDGAPRDTQLRARLAEAARARQSVRTRLGRILTTTPSAAALAGLESRLREQATVRATAKAVVRRVEVRTGERVLPSETLAILNVRDEYAAEFVTPEGSAAAKGDAMVARWQGGEARARVDSVVERKVPYGFRRNRLAATERAVRVRIHSRAPIAPGTAVVLVRP